MKPKKAVSRRSSLVSAFTSVVAFAMTCGLASGANQIWNNGSADSTWNTTSLNWDAGVNVWTNGNDATFGAAGAGTVTIAVGGVSAHNINFTAAGYMITGNALTLTGATPTIDVASSLTATINAPIVGSAGLTKTSGGTLVLGGLNTYTGATTISGGTLQVNNSLNAGSAVSVNTNGTLSGAGTINGTTSLNGGTISLTGAGNINNTLTVTATGGNWNGTGSVTGLTTVNGTLTLGAGANLTDNGGMTIAVGGTLAGVGTVSGNATLAGGTINLGSAGNITGTLAVTGASNWNGAGSVGGLITVSSTLTLGTNSVLTDNGGMNIAGGGTLAGSGTVSGTTGVTGGTINGSGLTLTGLTTFNGGGNILAGTETANAGVTLAAAAVVVQSGGILAGNLNTTSTGTFTANGTVTGSATVATGGTLAGGGMISGATGVTSGTINGSGLVLTGLVTFNGIGNNLVGAETATNGVTLAAGATVTQIGTLTGNLDTTNTGTFTANGAVSGNATVVAGGTLAGGGGITGTTNVTSGAINGTNLTLTGLVTFNGTNNFLTGMENATNGVTLAAGAAVAQSGTLTGNLNTTNTGTFTANGTVTGSATVAAGGTLAGSGHIAGTTGVTGGTINGSSLILTGLVTFNGTNNFLSGTETATNGVTLAAGATVTQTGTLTGNLNTTSTGTFTANGTVTGSATVAAGGTLAGTGSIGGASTLSGGTINLGVGGNINNSLGVTGGNWIGQGSVTGLVTSSSNTFTIGAGANLTANGGLAVTGGSIAGTGTITGSVNYTSTTGSTWAGVIAGTGSTLTMNSAGTTLTLTGANTYTGTTSVIAGTLLLANSAANNSTLATDNNTLTTSDITINGGTLQIAASEQIANTGSVSLVTGNFNFSGSGLTETIDKFTNSGGVFTTGANTLIGLGSTVTWSGGTNTINNGGVVQDAHIVITGGTNTVEAGGVLQLNASGTGLEMSNGATLTLNADNATPGKLVLNGDVSTSGNSTVTIASTGVGTLPGTIDLGGGNRTFNVADGTAATDLLISARITNGGLNKTGAGTLTLTSSNPYGGGTTINAGTLQLLNASLTGGGTVAVGTAGTLTGTAATIVGNVTLTGNGVVNLTGGTVFGSLNVTGGFWNGNASVLGTTTSSSGTFTIGTGANLIANGGLAVTGGSIVAGNAASTITGSVNYTSSTGSTWAGVIAGAGSALTLNAPGATLTLTGTNTYTGTTTVAAGTLVLNNPAANNATIPTDGNAATAPDILINGGTLQIAANEQIGNTGSISMTSGAFNFAGTGLTETIGSLTNSGGVFTSGANTLHGTGASITWSGGTNTVSPGGLVADQHIIISGGTNIVQGGATGGVLRLDAGGTGLEMSNGGWLTLNSDNAVPGKLVLLGNVSTSGNSTVGIVNGGANTHFGTIDLGGGTRTFTVADGLAPIDMYIDAVITNGALTKAGAGTLFLNGDQTYNGLTTVAAGTLAGFGNIGGSGGGLVNSGTVAPGGVGSLGTFTIHGDFTNNAGGTIAIDAGGAAHDLLVVTGTAHLNGTLTVTKFGTEMTPGQTFQIIQAGIYNPQGIMLNAVNFADLIGFNPATGFLTDEGAGSYTKASRTFLNLNRNKTETYLSLYDDAYNLGTQNVFITKTATDYTITRNGSILNGNPQLVMAELAVQGSLHLVGGELMVGPGGITVLNHLSPEVHRGMVDYTEQSLRTHVREGLEAAPVAQVGQTQVFATLHTTTAGAKDSANDASYNTDMYGATVGVRYDITKDFQIGGLLGADEGNIKGALIDTDATGIMFGIFSHYVLDQASKTTLTGSLSYGNFSYDASRQSYGGSARADGINSDAFEMSLGVRTVSFEAGGLKLIPNASVRYIKGSVDGFTEDSGPGAKLKVGSQGISSLLADVGVDIEYKIMEHFTLLGNVSYVTDFLDGDTNLSARYAASGMFARPFTVTAPGIDDQGLVLSIGAQNDLSANARIGVNYRNEFHQSSRDAQTVGIGATFGF